jgi:HSP20 family molecular chaperone IbpA
MNVMVRQDPWSLMPRLQDEINRLFGNVQQNDSSSSATAGWVPAVDINEYTNRFELYVDVPGVDPSSVELTLEDGVLTLSGERSARDRLVARMRLSIVASSEARASSIDDSYCRTPWIARRSTRPVRMAY